MSAGSGGDRLGARVAEFETAYLERARVETDLDGVTAVLAGRRHTDDPERVLGGWWCWPGEDEAVEVLPNPWDDRGAVSLYARYVQELGVQWAHALGAALDARHATARPRVYWELLVGPWLQLTLSQLLDRNLFVRAARALVPDGPMLAGSGLAVPATMWEATNLQLTDPWNALLIGEIAAARGLPQREVAVEALVTGPPERAAGGGALLGFARVAASRALRRLALGGPGGRRLALLGAHGLKPGEVVALNRAVGGVRPAQAATELAPASSGPLDDAARAALAAAGLDSGATDVPIAALLPRLLPRSLLEDYPSLIERSEAAFGADCAILDGSYSFIDAENEFVARSKVAGHPLAEVQHGGATLALASHPPSDFVAGPGSHFDRFFAWGPTAHAEALPHPRIVELRDRHHGGDDGVVIVEMLLPPQNQLLRFESIPLANQVYTELDRLNAFVEAVGPTRERLRLKRFPGLVAAAERPPALAKLPAAESRDRPTAVAWMESSRVAVLAYPDTPFIEAMLLGVPTIGLWGTDLWNWRDDAQEPFDALAAAGVVFSDPAAAATKLDEVYADADGVVGAAGDPGRAADVPRPLRDRRRLAQRVDHGPEGPAGARGMSARNA